MRFIRAGAGFKLQNDIKFNKILWKHVTFKILMAVTILVMFFRIKSPCVLVGKSQRFGEACCLFLQGSTKRPKRTESECWKYLD
jgi:hypothetical protein